MAPVKPMGTVGFHQEYNQEPGPRQDLNPDAVTDPSVLPKPLPAAKPVASVAKAPRAAKRTTKK